MISSLRILTSHDNNRPPGRTIRSSQEPIADSVIGRHLISISSEDKGGSERDDNTSEELTSIERADIESEKEREK
jgi:hypothetical protein